MRFGFFGINVGICADPEAAHRVAQAAEAAGFESLWTGEHVVLPDPQVPPSPVPPQTPFLDPAVSLAFLAGCTRRVRLATGIIILPQRNPVVLAKELASVDVLSGGRLVVGIGAGYLRPEFDAVGAPFAERGARTDEAIDVLRALWTQPKPRFAGRFFRFEGVDAQPRPVAKPCPPIVVGGDSDAAFARAVQRGNGWYGFAKDPEATAACTRKLADAARRFERPAALGRLELTVTPPGKLDRDLVRRYEDLGIDRLVPLGMAPSVDAALRMIDETAALAA